MKKLLKIATEREVDRISREFIAKLGRKPLPEGEARYERTTIRWKPEEMEFVKNVAGGAPIAETIRELALEAARARLNAR